MGSRSQIVLDDWDISLVSSSIETGVKIVRLGGMYRGWKWGEVLVECDLIVEWSLSTLLEKKLANMEGRDLKSILDGSWEIGMRCRSLLMELQSLRGFEEEEEISDELKCLLAWIMDEWYAMDPKCEGDRIIETCTRVNSNKTECHSIRNSSHDSLLWSLAVCRQKANFTNKITWNRCKLPLYKFNKWLCFSQVRRATIKSITTKSYWQSVSTLYYSLLKCDEKQRNDKSFIQPLILNEGNNDTYSERNHTFISINS